MKNNSLLGRIVDKLYEDMSQNSEQNRVIHWTPSTDDDDKIEFVATTNSDRGLLLYLDSYNHPTLGLERESEDGVDEELDCTEFPKVKEMYEHLVRTNYNLDSMSVDELIDFYFKTEGD